MYISLYSKLACHITRIFTRLCRFTYIVGVQSVRISHRAGKRSYLFFRPIGYLFRHIYVHTIGIPIRKIHEECSQAGKRFVRSIRRVRRAGRHGFGSASRVLFRSMHWELKNHGDFAAAVLRVVAPTLCVVVLVLTVKYWNGINFGLSLSNGGQQLAVVANEKTYEEATEQMKRRMVYDTAQQKSGVRFTPSFQLTMGNADYMSANDVCNLLIRESNGIIEEASGLYVDGQFFGAVRSSADLRYLLENRLSEAKGKEKETAARYTANVETVNGLYPTSSIMATENMKNIVNGSTTATTTYTVKKGDTVASIAAAKHTTAQALQKINPSLGNSMRVGDILQLQVSVPNLEMELTKTVTYDTVIPYTTTTKKDDAQYTDYSKVLTQGVNGKQRCVDIVHFINGVETKRESVSKTILVNPVEKVVLTGTKKHPINEKGVASGTFIWPVPSLRMITTYFEWRWGSFHKGIDISGSGAYGCTIVAADGGVVSLAGWNDGYGKCVIINHGNGKKTLYGHCSSLLVSAGEAVSKGQPIAKVGSTGYSTGAHCHFEVIVGGSNRNPLDYVS